MTIRRIRCNWRIILMKRRRMTLISTTRGSVTGELFLRTMKEVWIRRHCYMLSVGIYISTKRKNFLRVSIRWKLWGTIRKGYFGKWLEIMWWKSPVITLTSDLGGLILIFLMKTRRVL